MKVGRPIVITFTAICFKDNIKIYSFLIGFQRSYLPTLKISLSHTVFGIALRKPNFTVHKTNFKNEELLRKVFK
jgi:hypothetical protein